MAKQDLQPIYGDEAKMFRELFEKGSNRTTGTSGTYISSTSNIPYPYTNGEQGLFESLGTALENSNLVDDDINDLITKSDNNETNISTNSTNITNQGNDLTVLRQFATVTGTANAIVLTTPTARDFDLTIDGNPITFIPTANNTASVTVAVDSDGAIAIQKPDGAGGVTALEADDLQDGVPVTLFRRVTGDFFLFAPKGGSNVKLTQSGWASGGTGVINVPIQSVDTSKSVVVIYDSYAFSTARQNLTKGRLTSSSNLELRVDSSGGGNSGVFWQVIEFENVKSFQNITQVINNTSTETTRTIQSVDTSKTMVFYSMMSDYFADDDISSIARCRLDSSTQLGFKSNSSAFGRIEFQVYVVEFS